MRTVHRCDYCPTPLAREFDLAEVCALHEAGCEFNPANRTCATCSNLDYDERAQRRHVRPKCTEFCDRRYREHCPRWRPLPPPKMKISPHDD